MFGLDVKRELEGCEESAALGEFCLMERFIWKGCSLARNEHHSQRVLLNIDKGFDRK